MRPERSLIAMLVVAVVLIFAAMPPLAGAFPCQIDGDEPCPTPTPTHTLIPTATPTPPPSPGATSTSVPPTSAPPAPAASSHQSTEPICVVTRIEGGTLTEIRNMVDGNAWLAKHPSDFRMPRGGDCGPTLVADTPVPTATSVPTVVPPTATPTDTPVPPTATPTDTPVPPTATATSTPVPTATEEPTPTPEPHVPVQLPRP